MAERATTNRNPEQQGAHVMLLWVGWSLPPWFAPLCPILSNFSSVTALTPQAAYDSSKHPVDVH